MWQRHTLFRLRSSCLSSASVLPARDGDVAALSSGTTCSLLSTVPSSWSTLPSPPWSFAPISGFSASPLAEDSGWEGFERFFLCDLEILEDERTFLSFKPPDTAAV